MDTKWQRRNHSQSHRFHTLGNTVICVATIAGMVLCVCVCALVPSSSLPLSQHTYSTQHIIFNSTEDHIVWLYVVPFIPFAFSSGFLPTLGFISWTIVTTFVGDAVIVHRTIFFFAPLVLRCFPFIIRTRARAMQRYMRFFCVHEPNCVINLEILSTLTQSTNGHTVAIESRKAGHWQLN